MSIYPELLANSSQNLFLIHRKLLHSVRFTMHKAMQQLPNRCDLALRRINKKNCSFEPQSEWTVSVTQRQLNPALYTYSTIYKYRIILIDNYS